MHATDIVGYTYAADIYCEHCTAIMFETESLDEPSIFDGAEKILDCEAAKRGIDRYAEETFDSGEFPKVVFASMVEDEDERCGNCGESLI